MSNPHDCNPDCLVAGDFSQAVPPCPRCGSRDLVAEANRQVSTEQARPSTPPRFVVGATSITVACRSCGAVGAGSDLPEILASMAKQIMFDPSVRDRLASILAVANEPSYIWTRLRSDPAVISLATNLQLTDLKSAIDELLLPSTDVATVAWAYALLVTVGLQAPAELDRLVVTSPLRYLVWAEQIAALTKRQPEILATTAKLTDPPDHTVCKNTHPVCSLCGAAPPQRSGVVDVCVDCKSLVDEFDDFVSRAGRFKALAWLRSKQNLPQESPMRYQTGSVFAPKPEWLNGSFQTTWLADGAIFRVQAEPGKRLRFSFCAQPEDHAVEIPTDVAACYPAVVTVSGTVEVPNEGDVESALDRAVGEWIWQHDLGVMTMLINRALDAVEAKQEDLNALVSDNLANQARTTAKGWQLDGRRAVWPNSIEILHHDVHDGNVKVTFRYRYAMIVVPIPPEKST